MLDGRNLPGCSRLEQSDGSCSPRGEWRDGWGVQERAVVRVNTGQLVVRKLLLQQPGSSASCSGWRRASPGSSQLLLQHGRRRGCRL